MTKQSTIVVLHDALEQIEQNPKRFVKSLLKAINEFKSEETFVNKLNRTVIAGNHCNAAEVIHQSDSNHYNVLLVGHNTGQVLTKDNAKDYDHILEPLLKEILFTSLKPELNLKLFVPVLEANGELFLSVTSLLKERDRVAKEKNQKECVEW
jgi:hypothetical protein